MSKVLVVSNDIIGAHVAGPGIRAWDLGRQLARENEVRLAIPSSTPPVAANNLTLIRYESNGAALKEQLAWAEVLVVQSWSAFLYPFLVEPSKVLVFDLYNPSFFENLVGHADDVDSDREYQLQYGLELVRDLMVIGDFFICAHERQRDFWLGWLTALGRLNHLGYEKDPSFRALIDVVPFGIPDDPPCHTANVLKGVYPGIDQDDQVILWGGGMWQWLDPIICIEAMRRLANRRPDVKLFFLSAGEISAVRPQMATAQRARELSDEYGLTGRQVFFNESWVPYEQRQNYLLEADVGLVAHRPHIETHFSNRTRLLDCVWAELPIVITRGDVWGDWVEHYGLGRCVEHDADQIAQAILDVLATPREAYRQHFEQLARRLALQRAVKPLMRFCAQPAKAPDHSEALVARWQELRQSSTARRESQLLEYEEQIKSLLDHIAFLQEHIRAIQNGRVMKMLNRMDRWLGRSGQRPE
jgi:glycosyltransferase involved in cell wall biosynthesis